MDKIFTEEQRIEAKKNAKEASLRQDNMQHAKKIMLGIDNLDNNSSNRAIWELVQNARDLSTTCEITIKLTEKEFIFSHNGKTFTPDTLGSLIKQVSSKSDEDKELVGQYGTGFLTTHSFGRRFTVNGSLEIATNVFVDITDFEINRIAENSDELIEKLKDQLLNAEGLLDAEVSEKQELTSFHYYFDDDNEKNSAIEAVNSCPNLIPYVLTFNKKIHSFHIINDLKKEQVLFKRKSVDKVKDNLYVSLIEISNSESSIIEKEIYTLKNENQNIEVVLPLGKNNEVIRLDLKIPRIFFYFPLIGTELWGIDFIIHSSQFIAKEKRNGIWLKSKNNATSVKEENNRAIIEEASAMIFEYLGHYVTEIKNAIYLARINFNRTSDNAELDEYFNFLQTKWVNVFRDFPIVLVDDSLTLPAKDCKFLSETLIEHSEYIDTIHTLSNYFWNKQIPTKTIIEDWSKIVEEWNDNAASFIKTDDLICRITKENDHDLLHHFYSFLKVIGKEHIFDERELIPNRYGELKKKKDLISPLSVDGILFDIASRLIKSKTDKFVNTHFTSLFPFPEYTRKDLNEDITNAITEYNKKITENKKLTDDEKKVLIDFCSQYPNLETQSVQKKLMPLICNYYEHPYKEQELLNIKDFEIDYRPSFRCLLRNFFLEMSQKNTEWVKERRAYIHDVLFNIYNYKDFDELIKSSAIFINQNDKFCLPTELSKEVDMPTPLKVLYISICKKDIKDDLVANDFEQYWNFSGHTIEGITLANKIEDKFLEDRFDNIEGHPNRAEILNIIKYITEIKDNGLWEKLFPRIASKKEVIMMSTITDKGRKESMFKILAVENPNTLNSLAELSHENPNTLNSLIELSHENPNTLNSLVKLSHENPNTLNSLIELSHENPNTLNSLAELFQTGNLEQIIKLGKETLIEENNKKNDLEFKKEIGCNIEKLLQEGLQDKMPISLNACVLDEQGGQDIVIKINNEIYYYIEIKSRWSSEDSVEMSPLQMKRSVENKDCYALCGINLHDYALDNEKERFYPKFDDIKERIKVLTNIGTYIEPLLSENIKARNNPDLVTISGDYRGRVPQSLLNKQGSPFDSLVDIILQKLTN
ncbi:hypothetical protein EZS27_023812 [termite gut metagenome]|uniref:Protein NO VEIN C-terminal domain-containing protein n=1 Tax=termite gut metagenome TaxID=433724 RepID=A0A5J4R0H1_9ZZZZ